MESKTPFRKQEIDELKPIRETLTFKGKTALVTGAAGGLGYGVSSGLAELGANVAMIDIEEERLKKCAEYISNHYGVKTLPMVVDVTDEEGVKAAFAKTIETFGQIDVMHSNVGVGLGYDRDNGSMTYEMWKKNNDINYNAMFLFDSLMCNHLKDTHRTGAIVNTASVSAHIINRSNNRHQIAYGSAKSGVVGMTRGFAMDYANCGIRVNSISPGVFLSGIEDKIPNGEAVFNAFAQDVPLRRIGTIDEMRSAVIFLLSDLASYITGADLIIDGGYTCW